MRATSADEREEISAASVIAVFIIYIALRCYVAKDPDLGPAGVEPKSLRHELMRFVTMMLVPFMEVLLGFPPGKQPEFGRIIGRGKDFEAKESGSALDHMRPIDEGAAHLGFHAIGDGKAA